MPWVLSHGSFLRRSARRLSSRLAAAGVNNRAVSASLAASSAARALASLRSAWLSSTPAPLRPRASASASLVSRVAGCADSRCSSTSKFGSRRDGAFPITCAGGGACASSFLCSRRTRISRSRLLCSPLRSKLRSYLSMIRDSGTPLPCLPLPGPLPILQRGVGVRSSVEQVSPVHACTLCDQLRAVALGRSLKPRAWTACTCPFLFIGPSSDRVCAAAGSASAISCPPMLRQFQRCMPDAATAISVCCLYACNIHVYKAHTRTQCSKARAARPVHLVVLFAELNSHLQPVSYAAMQTCSNHCLARSEFVHGPNLVSEPC